MRILAGRRRHPAYAGARLRLHLSGTTRIVGDSVGQTRFTSGPGSPVVAANLIGQLTGAACREIPFGHALGATDQLTLAVSVEWRVADVQTTLGGITVTFTQG